MLIKIIYEELEAKINFELGDLNLEYAFKGYIEKLKELITRYNKSTDLTQSFSREDVLLNYIQEIRKILAGLKKMDKEIEDNHSVPLLTRERISKNVKHILETVEPALYGPLLKYDFQFMMVEQDKVIKLYKNEKFQNALVLAEKISEFSDESNRAYYCLNNFVLAVLNKKVRPGEKTRDGKKLLSDFLFEESLNTLKNIMFNVSGQNGGIVKNLFGFVMRYFSYASGDNRIDVGVFIDKFLEVGNWNEDERDEYFGMEICFPAEETGGTPLLDAEATALVKKTGRDFRESLKKATNSAASEAAVAPPEQSENEDSDMDDPGLQEAMRMSMQPY